MGAKMKVVSEPQATMQRKIGYIAIIKGVDYGERGLDIDDPTLYEVAEDCRAENQDTKGFLTVATVTWEEAA